MKEQETILKKAEEIGCSPQLARFIMNQNETIKTIVSKVERLEHEAGYIRLRDT